MFEGPTPGCGVDAAEGFTVFGGTRRLRDLARDELLVEEDILSEGSYFYTMMTLYCYVVVVVYRRGGLNLDVGLSLLVNKKVALVHVT